MLWQLHDCIAEGSFVVIYRRAIMHRLVTIVLFAFVEMTATQTLLAQNASPSQTSAKNSATKKTEGGKAAAINSAQKATAQAAERNSITKKPAEKSARELAFQRIDTSRDGKIDTDEFLGGSVGKAADSKRQEFLEFDLNKDGSLDFEEFKKQGNKPPDRAKLSEDFKNRDKDSDGSLTLKEFLGNRSGEQKTQARTAFFRFDSDGDDKVTLSEFLDRDATKKPNVHSHFRQLDLNEDKQLTEQEFMRPRIGKETEQAGRENFRKFDLNRDSRLNESEFAMLPFNNPDSKAIFRGRDGNQDGQLTLQEYLAGRPEGKSQLAARDAFYRMDVNGDGRLADGEFVQRDSKTKGDPKAKSDLKAKGKTQTPINVTSHFRQLDLDNNGQVTEQEFLRLKGGKNGGQTGRDSFKKYDVDGNGQLTESELAILPAHKPDAASTFRALDVDRNGGLTADELTRLMKSDLAQSARVTFARHDKDRSGELSLDEYLARQSAIEKQKSKRAWVKWRDNWGVRILIGVDALFLSVGGWWVYRKFSQPAARHMASRPMRATS
jgi:Ca2+-binding EF-hand superfamily protein